MESTASIEPTPTRRHWLALSMVVVSLAVIGYLGLTLGTAAPRVPRPGDPRKGGALPSLLPRGTVVTTLGGTDLAGLPASVSLVGDRPTVVFAYAPAIPWSQLNWPLFQQIARQRGERFRFVALCFGEPWAAYPSPPGVTVLAEPSLKTRQSLKLRAVPQTLVFSAAGAVEAVWMGPIRGAQKEEIARYFDVAFK